MAAKKSPKKSPKKPTTRRKPKAAAAKAKPKPKATVSAQAVNRGHLFSLRPRVSTAFRPEDFLAAKRELEGEAYESIEAAARAVAQRALRLTNEPRTKRDFNPSR